MSTIDYACFQRLALAIDRVYIDDLRALLDFFTVTKYGKVKTQWAPWENLYSSGLSKINVHIDVEKQRGRRASGSPYPVTEQKVTFTHNENADMLARVILRRRHRFARIIKRQKKS